MYRHLPLAQRLADLVANGAIGRLRLVRSSWRYLAEAPNIALDPELMGRADGGRLVRRALCSLACRRARSGPTASSGSAPPGADMVFAATMRHADGVFSQFDAGLVHGSYEQQVEVVGETGSLLLADPWYGGGPLKLRRPGQVEDHLPEGGMPYRRELEHFGAAIRGEVEPLLGRSDAVGQARALEALHTSAAKSRPVGP